MITVERHEKRSKTSLIFEKIIFFKFLAEKRHYTLSLMGRKEKEKAFFFQVIEAIKVLKDFAKSSNEASSLIGREAKIAFS